MITTPVSVAVVRLPHAADLPLPSYATSGAAGFDLLAAVTDIVEVHPGSRVLVPTGLRMAIPAGYEIQIRPRSGLALKQGIILPNAPGTIDEDYRGEVGVIILNAGQDIFTVTRGMRIAQAVLAPVTRLTWLEVHDLDATERGEGGFGSTGLVEAFIEAEETGA